MKRLVFIIWTAIFFTNAADGQLAFKKEEDETVDDLIGRISEPAIATYKINKRTTTDKKGTIYIYFIENTSYDSTSVPAVKFRINSIIAFSLITHDSINFSRSVIDTLKFVNGYEMPEIETVFFTNCDQDKDDELFILFFSFYEHHGLAGNLYRTWAYDLPKGNELFWKKNKKISSLFDDSDIGVIGTGNSKIKHKVKYNSEISIKRKLKELGY